GGVGDVHAAVGAAGGVPDHPRVHVAEEDLTAFGALPQTVHIVQQPADLGAGEVRRQRQTGLAVVAVLPALAGGEVVHQVDGAGVLPDDRVVDGFAGVLVPQHRRLPLVGDAAGGDVAGDEVRLRESSGAHLPDVGPD